MTSAFGGLLKKAERRFVKDSPVSLLIEDEIELTEKTKTITWQLMTTADVELVDGGAILHQDGKQLKIEVLSHPGMDISVISLVPAPTDLDRQTKGLKGRGLRLPAWTFEVSKGVRREEKTSELQSLMRISYPAFSLNKKKII